MKLRRKNISCLLKMIVIICALSGVWLSYVSGKDSFMGGSRVFMFFTIQSNIAIALISAVGLFHLCKNREISEALYTVTYVGTVSITLTGLVFCFVLAPTLVNHAWNLQNILTHVIVPAAAVTDFFVIRAAEHVSRKNIPLVTLPPVAYAVYAGIGYLAGWEFLEGIHYPYFFLNWGSPAGAFGFTDELPFMGCVWWILAILVLLLLIGWLYLFPAELAAEKERKT